MIQVQSPSPAIFPSLSNTTRPSEKKRRKKKAKREKEHTKRTDSPAGLNEIYVFCDEEHRKKSNSEKKHRNHAQAYEVVHVVHPMSNLLVILNKMYNQTSYDWEIAKNPKSIVSQHKAVVANSKLIRCLLKKKPHKCCSCSASTQLSSWHFLWCKKWSHWRIAMAVGILKVKEALEGQRMGSIGHVIREDGLKTDEQKCPL